MSTRWFYSFAQRALNTASCLPSRTASYVKLPTAIALLLSSHISASKSLSCLPSQSSRSSLAAAAGFAARGALGIVVRRILPSSGGPQRIDGRCMPHARRPETDWLKPVTNVVPVCVTYGTTICARDRHSTTLWRPVTDVVPLYRLYPRSLCQTNTCRSPPPSLPSHTCGLTLSPPISLSLTSALARTHS